MKPLKKNKIRALFFDIGGVCLTDGWERESRRKAAEYFSLDCDAMDHRHHRLYDSFQCGKLLLQGYLDQVVFYKKRNFSKETFFRFMKGQSKPYKTSLDILKRLKKQDKYLLAVLSNESTELNDFRIKKFKLNDYFTCFFSSCYLGVKKPEAQIYKIALDVTQLKPQEILYIDDREENIQTGRALGMNTIHLTDVKKLSEELKAYGIKY